MRIILGVSGGIAAYKAALVLRLLTEDGHDVRVIPTEAALQFVGAPTWEALSGQPVATQVWSDVPAVPHVQLGREADLVLVAPATADLLARVAAGLADDLLTNVLLTARCPILFAPAMHTEMWEHPATMANVVTLRSRGVHVLDPDSGRLTGADTGPGRLPEPEQIVVHALALTGDNPGPATANPGRQSLHGKRVVVTAGGTREALDPVRFLGNRSSGKQGYAVAADAARRGAEVTIVAANVASSLPDPPGCDIRRVESANELQAEVNRLVVTEDVDVVVMAAAVADYRPARFHQTKIKKRHRPGQGAEGMRLDLVRNPDILAGLVRDRAGERTPYLIGFAAETGDENGGVIDLARAKLARKGCDLLVANEVGTGKTFGQDQTTVHLLRPGTDDVITVTGSKAEAAAALWDAVAAELG